MQAEVAAWRWGASPKGKEKKTRGGAAAGPYARRGVGDLKPRREKLRFRAFLLVLNPKLQECAVLRGRVASCSDSRGDPFPRKEVPGSPPRSASPSFLNPKH